MVFNCHLSLSFTTEVLLSNPTLHIFLMVLIYFLFSLITSSSVPGHMSLPYPITLRTQAVYNQPCVPMYNFFLVKNGNKSLKFAKLVNGGITNYTFYGKNTRKLPSFPNLSFFSWPTTISIFVTIQTLLNPVILFKIIVSFENLKWLINQCQIINMLVFFALAKKCWHE